jgi:hypothetical protein
MRKAMVAVFLLVAPLTAVERPLRPETLFEAIAIGQSGLESRRTEFHQPYRLPIGQAPLDYVDVVTPFRKVVLATEARLRAGERLFGQRDALALLGDNPDDVEFRLELTFHPMNTFIGVPTYEVTLNDIRTGAPMEPRRVDRLPRFGPRVEGRPAPSPTQGVGIARGATQPLLGGTIVAIFDGKQLDPRGVYDVLVSEAGSTLARGRVDLSRLR